MKLFVLKRISAQLPKGTIYEDPNRPRARVLIAAKLARVATDEDERAPATAADDSAAQSSRRSYRRRDLTPEA